MSHEFYIPMMILFGALLLLVLLFGAGGIYSYVTSNKYDPDRKNYLRAGIIAPTLALLIGGLMYPFMISEYKKACNEYHNAYKRKTRDILSFTYDTGVEGHFCLGSGYVEDRIVYYYTYKVGDNAYQKGRLVDDPNKITLIETDEYTPSIYKLKDANKDPSEYYYYIYVPFGTVVVAYNF